MNENKALKLFRQEMIRSLRAIGYDVAVIAGRQPTRQLILDNAIYIFPIAENQIGLQARNYKERDGDSVGHTESVLISKTIQLQAFLKPSAEENYRTASDLCAAAKMVAQSMQLVESLRNEKIGISRVTHIREPEFINENGDYEKNPSFDFDLTFTREIKQATKPIIGESPEIKRI